MRTLRFSHLPIAGAVTLLTACAALAGIELPAGDSGVSADTKELRFDIKCPGDPNVQELKLQNVGTAEGKYTVTVNETPGGAEPPVMLLDEADQPVKTLEGTAKARAVTIVRVRATPIAPSTVTGSLTVKMGDEPEENVPVTVTTNGVDLVITPTLIDFGEIRETEEAPAQVITIENTGSLPVQIDGFQIVEGGASQLAIDLPAGSTLPPKGKIDTHATFAKSAAGPQVSAKLEPITRGTKTCAKSPAVTLKGTRVNRNVLVTPPTLDFGEADCKSGASAPKTITLTNYGNIAVAFNVTGLAANSKYSVTPKQGSVEAAPLGETRTATITVTREAFTEEVKEYPENLQIEMSADKPYTPATVALNSKSVGAVITFKPDPLSWPISFGSERKSITVTNSGNKFVSLIHDIPNGAPFSIVGGVVTNVFPSGVFSLQHDGTIDVQFGPASSGNYSAKLTTARQNSPATFPPLPESGIVCNVIGDVSISGLRVNPN